MRRSRISLDRRPSRGAVEARCVTGLLMLLAIAGCGNAVDRESPTAAFPELRGPYLGQTPPGATPEPFAPGVVCTGIFERDVAMTPDGDEIYFCRVIGNHDYSTILVTRLVEGVWSEPEVVPFARDPRYKYLEPHVTPDGGRLLFLCDRPDTARGETEAGDQDIWAVDRAGEGWGEPYNIGPPVNSDAPEFFPSMTEEGTLYFCRQDPAARAEAIFRATALPDGGYAEPERLPETVNGGAAVFNAFVAPDESYVIACTFGREDAHDQVDYYLSFRAEGERWLGPVNLGEAVNAGKGRGWSPYVTPDGRYFFFMTSRMFPEERGDLGPLSAAGLDDLHNRWGNGQPDIYWVDAAFLHRLRPPR